MAYFFVFYIFHHLSAGSEDFCRKVFRKSRKNGVKVEYIKDAIVARRNMKWER